MVPGFTGVDNYYFWDHKYVSAFNNVLPEGDPNNINKKDVVADFNFVSDGSAFTIYPVYWQTTGHDVLGVYWYENGHMKTCDLFDNRTKVGDQWDDFDLHNIYHRPSQLSQLNVLRSNPGEGSKNVATSGTIMVYLNQKAEKTSSHSAKLTASGKSDINLGDPTVSEQDGSTVATYSYSGLDEYTDYTLTIAEGSFVTTGKPDYIASESKLSKYTATFKTIYPNTPVWTSTTYDVDGLDISITVKFDREIAKGKGNASYWDAAGTNITIQNPTISADNMSLILKFTVSDYDADYRLFLPETGFIVAKDNKDVNAVTTGYDADNKHIFHSGPKPADPAEPTYAEQGILAEVKEINKQKNQNGVDFLKTPNDVFEAKLLTRADTVEVKYYNVGMSGDLPGSGTFSFTKGYRLKTDKPTSEKPGYTPNNDYIGVEITAKENAILNVYSWKNAITVVNTADNKAVGQNKQMDTWTATDDKGAVTDEKSYQYSLEIVKGQTYRVTCGSWTYFFGFSYQPEVIGGTNSADPQTVRRTVRRDGDRSRATNASTAPSTPDGLVNGQKYDFNPEDRGFIRTGVKSKEACGTDATADDVLTGKITFQLPTGTMFGFYLRNESGAQNITGPAGDVTPYTNYSMSVLNKEQPNSFFNNLREVPNSKGESEHNYFTSGWGTKDATRSGDKQYHDKLYRDGKLVDVSEKRKYSTASTYTVDIEGEEMRYFSFEDWVDYDFNDIAFMVAPENKDIPVVKIEADTKPYFFAIEDLGAISSSDLDFNDVVFGVEHVSGMDSVFVTVLAAGGTLPTKFCFKGQELGNGVGEIVFGPHLGKEGYKLSCLNDWFDEKDESLMINVGTQGISKSYGSLTTVGFIAPDGFTLSGLKGNNTSSSGFSIRVKRNDDQPEWTEITEPDATGEAPQILILPSTWKWPTERTNISDAYNGCIDVNGNTIPSFRDWVQGAKNNTEWYKSAVDCLVIEHPWNGSLPARNNLERNQK